MIDVIEVDEDLRSATVVHLGALADDVEPAPALGVDQLEVQAPEGAAQAVSTGLRYGAGSLIASTNSLAKA
jgi:hypothetical protein